MGRAALLLCLIGCGRIGFGDRDDARDHDGITAGDGTSALGCADLAPTCGATASASCCTSPVVPGGMFLRSYDVGTDNAYTDMTNPATVSDFRLDTYEVTVGRFRQFVAAGFGTQQHPPAAGAGGRTLNGTANQGGWDASWNGDLVADPAALVAAVNCDFMYATWTDAPGTNENLAMNCITWFEAMAFCVSDGGFLPTEAEWNYAAAGGSEQRAYPWSSPPGSLAVDCSYANYYNGTSFCTDPTNGAINRVGSESPKGDGRWGQADLGGNAYEWTLDWFASPYPQPCNDCAALTATGGRTARGGIFNHVASFLRGALRSLSTPPTARDYDYGVRCARLP